MGDTRAPYELTLKYGVDAEGYEAARRVGRQLAEHIEAYAESEHVVEVKLVDFRVERRGAMRP